MSGGAYDYAYNSLDEFIETMEVAEFPDEINIPLRRKFAAHLRLVRDAMQAVEWVDSGDCSPPHDEDAIRRVLGE